MYKYYVNGKCRELSGSWCSWHIYDDSGKCLCSSVNILDAILEADYDCLTWDQARKIESDMKENARRSEKR